MSEPFNYAEFKRLLEMSGPLIEKLRNDWARQMVTTLPEETEKRERYYAMICGLNAFHRESMSWAMNAMQPATDQPAGWNGLPLETDND